MRRRSLTMTLVIFTIVTMFVFMFIFIFTIVTVFVFTIFNTIFVFTIFVFIIKGIISICIKIFMKGIIHQIKQIAAIATVVVGGD